MEKSYRGKVGFFGCGDYPMDGAVNVDIRDLPGVDVVADLSKRLPFEDGELDGVISRNIVEHFARGEYKEILKEWGRVVKKGGFIRTETVDMGGLMDKWRDIPEENWLDGILGAQTYDENFHKMAFTSDILSRALEEGGLEVTGVEKFETREIPRMIITATKK